MTNEQAPEQAAIAALEQRCAGMERDITRLEGERGAARLRLDAQDETIRALTAWVAELHEACAATFAQTGKLVATTTERDADGNDVTSAVEHDMAAPWRAAPLAAAGECERRRDGIGAQLEGAKGAGARLMGEAAPSTRARSAAAGAAAGRDA